jgi:hypothetical protein
MARKPKKTEIIATEPSAAPAVVKTVKGFDRDLKCRGFQFEVGKTYLIEGEVVVCRNGWHACENPLDVFNYYKPGVSRFHEVEQSGTLVRHDEDTKIASATITIGVELSIGEIVSRAVKWIFDKATVEKESTATSGYMANAATSGERANAATSGERANAATSGERANAATSGDGANAATSGYRANAATSGYGANAATSGYGANAATSGDWANAATSGNWANAATSGKHSVAAALGSNAKAKAGDGGAICLVCRDDDGDILAIRASKVGENGVKADVWYSLNASGEFVEEAE